MPIDAHGAANARHAGRAALDTGIKYRFACAHAHHDNKMRAITHDIITFDYAHFTVKPIFSSFYTRYCFYRLVRHAIE